MRPFVQGLPQLGISYNAHTLPTAGIAFFKKSKLRQSIVRYFLGLRQRIVRFLIISYTEKGTPDCEIILVSERLLSEGCE